LPLHIKKDNPLEILEIEVKFYAADSSLIRSRILDLGAVSEGRVFESNIRFEDADKSLMKRRSLLRLRQDTAARLTFKSSPLETDHQFKIRRELEVEVSDFSAMQHILEELGFQKVQVYEKWRETFIFNDIHLCMDTMPYGNFLEIEGKEKQAIKALADRLSLRWEKRILANYLGMFAVIREDLNLTFSDLTFDNFKNLKVDFTEYLDMFEIMDN
jgi:adenylate cyclase class 2